MFRRVLQQIRERVRTRRYLVTLHADEEMDDDGFSIFDVEHALLTGAIEERQKDPTTGEWKYRLVGSALDDRKLQVITKLSVTGKLVIITIYDPSGGTHAMR